MSQHVFEVGDRVWCVWGEGSIRTPLNRYGFFIVTGPDECFVHAFRPTELKPWVELHPGNVVMTPWGSGEVVEAGEPRSVIQYRDGSTSLVMNRLIRVISEVSA